MPAEDATPTLCSNCGASPCYHICPNSPHYYSAEQERYDDQFYGQDDMNERYAAERADMEREAEEQAYYDEMDDYLNEVHPIIPPLPYQAPSAHADDTDSIPF